MAEKSPTTLVNMEAGTSSQRETNASPPPSDDSDSEVRENY